MSTDVARQREARAQLRQAAIEREKRVIARISVKGQIETGRDGITRIVKRENATP